MIFYSRLVCVCVCIKHKVEGCSCSPNVKGKILLLYVVVVEASCYSKFYSADGSNDDSTSDHEICQVLDSRRVSCSVVEPDYCRVDDSNNGVVQVNVQSERDCRICQLSVEMDAAHQENGIAIELGCSCKDDLAAAHKHCAEAWFKIKGNK